MRKRKSNFCPWRYFLFLSSVTPKFRAPKQISDDWRRPASIICQALRRYCAALHERGAAHAAEVSPPGDRAVGFLERLANESDFIADR